MAAVQVAATDAEATAVVVWAVVADDLAVAATAVMVATVAANAAAAAVVAVTKRETKASVAAAAASLDSLVRCCAMPREQA